MPDQDGYSLTSKIRQLPDFSSTPIVALTANVMRGDRERSLEAGCDGYIQKPIDIDIFPQQIERFMNKTSARVVPSQEFQSTAPQITISQEPTLPNDCTMCRILC